MNITSYEESSGRRPTARERVYDYLWAHRDHWCYRLFVPSTLVTS